MRCCSGKAEKSATPLIADIKIVSDQYARDWLASEALRITEDAMTKTGNNIQAVVASNDGTAGGAVQALGPLASKVIVTGQDAQLDAVQRIVEGRQSMTIYKPIKPLPSGPLTRPSSWARRESRATGQQNNYKIDGPPPARPIVADKNNVASQSQRRINKMEEFTRTSPKTVAE